jgi:hypothetical protein
LQRHDQICESSNTGAQFAQVKESDRAPIIKRSLEPLHKDLVKMNDMLHECSRKPSVHVADKVRYMVLYKAKLDGFRDKLPEHRASVSVIRELIDGGSQGERRASALKLAEFVENHERQQEKQELYDRAQEEVVKTFEERLPSTKDMRHLSTCEILEQLEDDLVAKGVSPEATEEQLFPITKALLLQPLPKGPYRDPTIPQPAFKLDVFESALSANAAGGLHRSKHKGGSEFKKANSLTRGADLRAASLDNLSALFGDKGGRSPLGNVSASMQEPCAPPSD